MKKIHKLGMTAACTAIAAGVLWLCFGEKIKILHTSLKSFKDENLAYTFQHTPEIQPTKENKPGRQSLPVSKGRKRFPGRTASGLRADFIHRGIS